MKTKITEASVDDFLNGIADAQVRDDCRTIAKMMQAATKAKPKMYGSAIVGFGEHTVVYADGREVPWMLMGFSPRKQNLTLYIGVSEQSKELLSELGKHSTGKGCLYIKRLSDVSMPALKKLVAAAVARKKAKSPARR